MKHEKTRKTRMRGGVGESMCRGFDALALLRSNIQGFVQEGPVGQTAQGTPLSVPAVAQKGGG